MATLLTIVQAVAKDVGIYSPIAKVVNNEDDGVIKLLRAATAAARRIYKDHDWAILQREYTFNAVDGSPEYDLPSDFGRFIDDTVWDRDQFWQMRGPMTAQEWQIAKSALISSTSMQKRWRVKRASAIVAKKFVIDPTPSDTNDLVFEYVSNSWATAANGTTLRTDWVADTDIPILDSELIEVEMIWRMLRFLERDFEAEKIEADREIDRAWARDGGMPIIRLTAPHWRGPMVNTGETNFGS